MKEQKFSYLRLSPCLHYATIYPVKNTGAVYFLDSLPLFARIEFSRFLGISKSNFSLVQILTGTKIFSLLFGLSEIGNFLSSIKIYFLYSQN